MADDFSDLNLDMDEAFTVRTQFGIHLGKLKDWIVMMGQLPMAIDNMMGECMKDGIDGMKPWTNEEVVSTFSDMYENLTRGIEVLAAMLQQSAVDLYGEPFSTDSFVIPALGIGLKVGGLELSIDMDIVKAINDLPEEVRNAAIRALRDVVDDDRLPEELRERIQQFLREQGE